MAEYYRHRMGLWLPYPPDATPQTKGSLDFMCVNLSYEQAFEESPTWEAVARELEPYSIEHIVDVVSRLGIALHRSEGPIDIKVQHAASIGIFGLGLTNDIINAARRVDREIRDKGERSAPLVLFHEQQVLSLLKFALLTKEVEAPDTSKDLVGLGKSLMMLGDLAAEGPEKLTSLNQDDPAYLGRWLQYIVANGLFHVEDVGSYALARCHDLYLIDHKDLSDSESYVNLPTRIRSVTELEPDVLWASLLALILHWKQIGLEDIGDKVLALNRDEYFTKNSRTTDEESERFFATCTADIKDLQEQVRERYSIEDMRPFDVLPFAQTPLVSIERWVRPVSMNLLMRKATTGLYHLHIDSSIPRKDRGQFQIFSGKILEKCVDQLFARIYSAQRYVTLDPLRKRFGGSYSDGIIVYPDGLVVIEIKASLFSLAARVGSSLDQLEERFREIYYKGPAQIDATIKKLRGSAGKVIDQLPSRIDWYQPLLVTLEETPMNPLTYGKIKRLIEPEGLLSESDIRPLQVINVAELEQIEGITAAGRATFDELFAEKLASGPEVDDSWSNFLYRRREKFTECPNTHLGARFEELADEATAFFENRKLQ